jgi:hypothetical protein
VQVQAFGAFNYTAPGGKPGEKPHAARDRADAVAQAAASSVPAPAQGGAGERGRDQKGDAARMSYADWKNLSAKEQAALLGED